MRAGWRARWRSAELTLEDCATLRATGLAVEGRFALRGPLELCIAADSTLRIRAPAGAPGGSSVGVEADFTLAGAPVSALAGGGDTTLRVEGELPELQVHVESDAIVEGYRVRIESRGGRVAVPLYAVEVRGLDLRAAFDSRRALPSGEIHLREIFDPERRGELPVLELSGEFAPDAQDPEERLGFSLLLRDAMKIVQLHLRGVQDVRTASGRAELELEPLRFSPDGPQPLDLVPSLPVAVKVTAGSLELTGELLWDPENDLRGHADVVLRELSIASEQASLERVSGAIRVLGPFPPSTPPHQILIVGRVDSAVELLDGVIDWRLRPDGEIDLHATRWQFAGGELRGDGRYSPSSDEADLRLELESVELTRLLELVALEGLTGTGRLAGELPLHYGDGRLQILPTTLAAERLDRPGGWIRYRPGSAAAMARNSSELAMLYEILANFYYERLAIELRGDAFRSLVFDLHLAGANPDYQNGQQVEFNLELEVALADLLRGAAVASRLPDVLSERLRRQVDGPAGGR